MGKKQVTSDEYTTDVLSNVSATIDKNNESEIVMLGNTLLKSVDGRYYAYELSLE